MYILGSIILMVLFCLSNGRDFIIAIILALREFVGICYLLPYPVQGEKEKKTVCVSCACHFGKVCKI